MGDIEHFRDYKELEQIIRGILTSDPGLSLTEIEHKDFSGKDKIKAGAYNEQALEDSLIAARGYELRGDGYARERAYALDRAARCLDEMLGLECRLYAELKEKAACLFESISSYKDAGYSYLRAADGYASARDIKKAIQLVEKSDNVFGIIGFCDLVLREKVIAKIQTQLQQPLNIVSSIPQVGTVGEIEQKIHTILTRNTALTQNQLNILRGNAKQHYKEGKYDLALDEYLTIARAYEFKENNLNRAYSLDRAARCLGAMIKFKDKYVPSSNSDINKLIILYSELNETAANLFETTPRRENTPEEKYAATIAYALYRAAYGYATAGNIEKAKENLEKGDQTGICIRELRHRIVLLIEKANEKSL